MKQNSRGYGPGAERTALERALLAIEVVGNRLPDPAALMV